MSYIDELYEIIKKNDVTRIQLEKLGYTRFRIQTAIRTLCDRNLVFIKSNGKFAYYTINKNAALRTSTDEIVTGVPDLPADLLLLMGYTAIKPKGGYIIKGDSFI